MANKIDLDEERNYLNAIEAHKSMWKYTIYPSSARSGEGINEAIEDLVNKAFDFKVLGTRTESTILRKSLHSSTMQSESTNYTEKKKGGCCK